MAVATALKFHEISFLNMDEALRMKPGGYSLTAVNTVIKVS